MFLKGFVFFVLFLPMFLLAAVSHYLHPKLENVVDKSKSNFLFIPLVILLAPVVIPVTVILNQAYDWWDKLGGD